MSDEEVLDAELVSDDNPVLLTEPAGPMTKLQALAVVLEATLLAKLLPPTPLQPDITFNE